MIRNIKYCLLLFMMCFNSLLSQIDLSVQYDKLSSFSGGDVFAIVLDAPVKSISVGGGILYSRLGDYRFLPVIGTNPDGSIGKGSGLGFHLNSKYFFTEMSRWFVEPSFNMSFINQDDEVDIGVFTTDRDQSYSVIQPLLSVGYLIGKSKGVIVALKSGAGVQFYSNVGDSFSQGVFQFSLQLGYRFNR